MQIELDSLERRMLLDALTHPPYKDKIEHPATKRFIRDVWKALKQKLISDERLHEDIISK